MVDESSGVAIDPAVRALVAEELARSTRVQRGRADAPRLLGQLDSLGRKLYPYQLEGVERFITHGRLLLADDMGLGKTTQAIAACHVLQRSKKVRRGLLIVPAALKPQWLREWQATTDIAITSVDGTPEARAARTTTRFWNVGLPWPEDGRSISRRVRRTASRKVAPRIGFQKTSTRVTSVVARGRLAR
jgi:SNF2 family DNA or RNA helicase